MTSRTTRHHITLAAAIATATAAALMSTALTASAAPRLTADSARPSAAPVALSAAARTGLIRTAQAGVARTAEDIGLGAKEKLVVKDVVKDADGAVHTRYERTYQGLPVLGGDLIVHTAASGSTQGVTRATKAKLKLTTLTPRIAATTAQNQALSLAKDKGSAKATTDRAPRKVVWAANGTPVLAYETVIGGLQDDGTPNRLHVITDATTGKKLFQYQGIETGVGNTHYSGKVDLSTAQSGSSYTLTDDSRGGHKTYDLDHKQSGTGTLFTQDNDTWGDGTTTNAATAAADAAYGAQTTWDFYKDTFGRNGIKNDGTAAYSRVHYGTAYVNAFWDDSCFCMTYGDGTGDSDPLTSLDVAGHEMSHGVTSNTAGLEYSGESGGLNEATSDIMGTGVEFAREEQHRPGRLPHRREDRHQRRRQPAALHGQAQQGRRLRRLLDFLRRQRGRPLLVGRRQPLLLPAVRGQWREDHRRRRLRLAHQGRLHRHRHRPGQGPPDLVQGADELLHVDDRLRRAPARAHCPLPVTCTAPTAPSTRRSRRPGPGSTCTEPTGSSQPSMRGGTGLLPGATPVSVHPSAARLEPASREVASRLHRTVMLGSLMARQFLDTRADVETGDPPVLPRATGTPIEAVANWLRTDSVVGTDRIAGTGPGQGIGRRPEGVGCRPYAGRSAGPGFRFTGTSDDYGALLHPVA